MNSGQVADESAHGSTMMDSAFIIILLGCTFIRAQTVRYCEEAYQGAFIMGDIHGQHAARLAE